MNAIDPYTTVSALIAAAGLEPDPEEISIAVENYPALRKNLDRLHDFLPNHEEEPLLQFWADPSQ